MKNLIHALHLVCTTFQFSQITNPTAFTIPFHVSSKLPHLLFQSAFAARFSRQIRFLLQFFLKSLFPLAHTLHFFISIYFIIDLTHSVKSLSPSLSLTCYNIRSGPSHCIKVFLPAPRVPSGHTLLY